MAKKKNQNINSNVNENDGGGDDCGKKQKAAGVTVVVLKMDLHCEGCAGKVVKAVCDLDGVESVRIGDSQLNKITVTGNLDPVKLRKKVEEKTKKKVELISPATKKTDDGDNSSNCCSGNDKKKQQKPPPDMTKTAVKKDEKKPKELPVTVAVFKVPLHCKGCVRRIHKLVSKTKGYVEISIDKNKDLVTVKGAIDMKLLAEALQHKLKRAVEIVPAKKDGGDAGGGEKGKGGGGGNDGEGKGGGGGGEKKGKGDGGGEKKGKAVGGGEKKGKRVGGDHDGDQNDGGKAEGRKMEGYGGPMGYPYPQNTYGPGYVDIVHAPQLFSDENPHACFVM